MRNHLHARRRASIAAVALAALAAPAAADAKPSTLDGLYIDGYIERTTISTERCKAIVGNDVYLTDIHTSVYRRTIKGTGPVGKRPGKVTVERTFTTTDEHRVEGDSEYYLPYVNGPVTTKYKTQRLPWTGFVSRVTAGRKGGKQQYSMYVDFRALDDSLDVDLFAEVPRKGSSKLYPFDEALDPGPVDPDDDECTRTRITSASGSITLGRSARARG